MKVTYRADGFAEYRTIDGDKVDQIAFDFYGTHEGTTEFLYEDNPALVAMPMILSAGLIILLRPPPTAKAPASQIELWSA